MAAVRKSTARLSESWRERIKSAELVHRLQQHAQGKLDMSRTQIKAAEILLRKCIPDLASVQHSGEMTHSVRAEEMPDDRLAAIAAGGSVRAAAKTSGPQEPASVH